MTEQAAEPSFPLANRSITDVPPFPRLAIQFPQRLASICHIVFNIFAQQLLAVSQKNVASCALSFHDRTATASGTDAVVDGPAFDLCQQSKGVFSDPGAIIGGKVAKNLLLDFVHDIDLRVQTT